MTTGTESTPTVSRETLTLMPLHREGEASTTIDASARAEALSWASNTRKAYVAGWNDLTSWCIRNCCLGLPATPAVIGCYLEDLVEVRSVALTTARNRLAAIAAASPPEQAFGSGEEFSGQGHPEATGEGVRKAPQAGQGADQRGPYRGEGYLTDPAGPQGQAPAQGDRGPGGSDAPPWTWPYCR